MKALACIRLSALLTVAACASHGQSTVTNVPVASTSTTRIPGEHVRAIAAVLDRRRSDSTLSDGERALENFDVYVSEADGMYKVNVVPRPDEYGSVGGATEYGREIRYFVSANDFVVIRSEGAK
jgi:hypothetical protein